MSAITRHPRARLPRTCGRSPTRFFTRPSSQPLRSVSGLPARLSSAFTTSTFGADLRQKLGQHFLVKGKTLERIARAACGEGVALAVEIGPGRGALTERLLAHAGHVVAIEIDPVLAAHVRERWPDAEVKQANALDADWS